MWEDYPRQPSLRFFLQLEGIEHRTIRVRCPQSNGFVVRLHRVLFDEYFRIQGRKNWYESLDETQIDLDAYLHHFNPERARQGRNMNGRTPARPSLMAFPQASRKRTAKGSWKRTAKDGTQPDQHPARYGSVR